MSFLRHFRVLIWKNALLKVRHPVAAILEIVLPIAFAGAMAGIFTLFEFEKTPVSAFVSYGQDIQHINEFQEAAYLMLKQKKRLAIIPGNPEMIPYTQAFIRDMSQLYTPFNGSTAGGRDPVTGEGGGGWNTSQLRDVYLPGFRDVYTEAFSSEQELEEWIKNTAYPGIDPFKSLKGRIWAAIIFKSGPPHWEYSIRMNASEVPNTVGTGVDTLQRGSIPWNLYKYATATPFFTSGDLFGGGDWNSDYNDLSRRGIPGFLPLQLLIDRWILNISIPLTSWSINDVTRKIGNAYWTAMGPDSNMLWNEFWGPPPDNDWQMKNEWRANMTKDMLAYSASGLFFPHGVDIAPFPITSYIQNYFYPALQYNMPLLFVLSFMYPTSRLLHALVYEKEAKLREGMRQMGVNDAALLLSWLVSYEVQYLILSACVAAVLSNAVFAISGFGPVFLLFALFGTASVAFAAFMSVFFAKARTAATMGSLAFIASFFPYYGTGTMEGTTGRAGKIGASVLPPTAFATTLTHLMVLEGGGTGIRFTSGPDGESNVSAQVQGFAYVDGIALLAASSALFAFLAWYVDAILPYPMREYGVPLPWYFPCSRVYWRDVCGRTAGMNEKNRKTVNTSDVTDANVCIKALATWCKSRNKSSSMSQVGVLSSDGSSAAGKDVLSLSSEGKASASPSTHGAMMSLSSPSSSSSASTAVMMHINPSLASSSSLPIAATTTTKAAISSISGFVEPPDSQLQAKAAAHRCVTLQDMRKEFTAPNGSIKVAVDNVNLTLYEGQICVLLGHNGAGKTTLIGMLTGLINPDSGSATVFGHELGTDMASIRKNLGVCPQHDVLWPELTVTEHLQLFAEIKGLTIKNQQQQEEGTASNKDATSAAADNSSSSSSLQTQITRAINDVGLSAKAHSQTSTLSGGQKRKLSVALALLGDSKVVLLDEPTSGMDPYSRRSTWQLLQRAREGRVIVLTTHFMDEADILGDRIAIMSGGKLHSAGTPMFLKRSFGVGYTLTMERAEMENSNTSSGGSSGGGNGDATVVTITGSNNDNNDGGGSGNNSNNDNHTYTASISTTNTSIAFLADAVVRKHVPEAETTSSSESKLTMRLPLHASASFPKLLAELETFVVGAAATAAVGGTLSSGNAATITSVATTGNAFSIHGVAVPPLCPLGIGVTTMEDVFLRVESHHAAVAAVNNGMQQHETISPILPSSSSSSTITQQAVAIGRKAVTGRGGTAKSLPNTASTSLSILESSVNTATATAASAAPPPPPITLSSPPVPIITARQAGFCVQFTALLYKRALYARRDLRAACLQLLLPIIMVVVGFALLNLGNQGDQPEFYLNPSKFNADPSDASASTPKFPHRVPAFTFKYAGWPEPSADLEAIVSAFSVGDASIYDAGGPSARMDIEVDAGYGNGTTFSVPYQNPKRMQIGLYDAQAVFDAYDIMHYPRGDGPRNDGFPSLAFANMASWLVAEKEAQVRDGLSFLQSRPTPGSSSSNNNNNNNNTNPAMSTPITIIDENTIFRDGASIYGAVVFTSNGSNLDTQSSKSSFLPCIFDQEAIRATHTQADVIANLQFVNEQAPDAFLTYGLLLNTSAAHSAPIFMNYVHNVLYRIKLAAVAANAAAGESLNSTTYNASIVAALASARTSSSNIGKGKYGDPGTIGSISVSTHPLPFTAAEAIATSAVFTFGAAAIITMAFAFLPATYASFVVKERETGAKHQQRLSGVTATAYWGAAYAFDALTCTLPASVTIIAAWGFGIDEFTDTSKSRIYAFLALFALYGTAVAPFSYVLSFAFKTSGGAQTGVLLLSVISLLLMIASLAMRQIPSTCEIEATLRYVFRLLPGYALGNGLMQLSFLTQLPAIDAACLISHGKMDEKDMSNLPKYDALELDATGWNILYLAIESVVYWCIAVAIDAGEEHPAIRSWRVRHSASAAAIASAAEEFPEDEDDDVRNERKRIDAAMKLSGGDNNTLKRQAGSITTTTGGGGGGGGGGNSFSDGQGAAVYSVVVHRLRKIFPAQVRGLCYFLRCSRTGSSSSAAAGTKGQGSRYCCCCCCRRPARVVREELPLGSNLKNDRDASASSSSSSSFTEDAFAPKVAVANLSFALHPGDIFGFLGMNGAGKTTTLQVLSGDTLPTSGSAQMAGYDIITEQHALRKLLGYCPQFDALLDLLTVKEHLELYARVRGVTAEAELQPLVHDLITRLDLGNYTNNLAGTLSGGNKRKLSVAIALIGNPPNVFLDEPSTGMDPVAKRFMWKVISRVATEQKQCSIILTTHSMEEVEALCTRIGIMVGGKLACLGSAQHLKSTHGQGFQLQLQLRTPTENEVNALIRETVMALQIPCGAVGGGATAARDPTDIELVAVANSLRLDRAFAERICVALVSSSPSSSSSSNTTSGGIEGGKAGPVATSTTTTTNRFIHELREGGNGWAIAADLQHHSSKTSSGKSTFIIPAVGSSNNNSTLAGTNTNIRTTATPFELSSATEPATSGGVTLQRFCMWIAEEELANAAIRYFCDDSSGALPGGGTLLERHGATIRLRLRSGASEISSSSSSSSPRPPPSLSALFATLEAMKQPLGILTYGLGETTLEQVFNTIAAEGGAKGGGKKPQQYGVEKSGVRAAPLGRGERKKNK